MRCAALDLRVTSKRSTWPRRQFDEAVAEEAHGQCPRQCLVSTGVQAAVPVSRNKGWLACGLFWTAWDIKGSVTCSPGDTGMSPVVPHGSIGSGAGRVRGEVVGACIVGQESLASGQCRTRLVRDSHQETFCARYVQSAFRGVLHGTSSTFGWASAVCPPHSACRV